jgi:hypothetical protein
LLSSFYYIDKRKASPVAVSIWVLPLDDVFVFAPLGPVVEQGDAILGAAFISSAKTWVSPHGDNKSILSIIFLPYSH